MVGRISLHGAWTRKNGGDVQMTEIYPDINYKICLDEKTKPEYRFMRLISEWLQYNLINITDDNNEILFSKVNTGFNENNLKNFGRKPTCDVFIDNIEYDPSFDYVKPIKAHSIIIYYLKGANNNAYMAACDIHDYLMQEFTTNDNFIYLEDIVSDTLIKSSRVMNQPVNKKWGVMGAFELQHDLY